MEQRPDTRIGKEERGRERNQEREQLLNQDRTELTVAERDEKNILFYAPTMGISRQPMSVLTPTLENSTIRVTAEIMASMSVPPGTMVGEPLIVTGMDMKTVKIFLNLFAPTLIDMTAEKEALEYVRVYQYSGSSNLAILRKAIGPMLNKADRYERENKLSLLLPGTGQIVPYASMDQVKRELLAQLLVGIDDVKGDRKYKLAYASTISAIYSRWCWGMNYQPCRVSRRMTHLMW